MFEQCNTHTDQGNLGEARAMYELTKLGYIVSKPLFNNQKYDFIMDDGITLKKVQVKTSQQSTPSTHGWNVGLVTSGGSKAAHTRRKRNASDYDLLFILTSGDRCWLIPEEHICGKASIVVGNIGPNTKYHEFELNVDVHYLPPKTSSKIWSLNEDDVRIKFKEHNGNYAAVLRYFGISSNPSTNAHLREICNKVAVTKCHVGNKLANVTMLECEHFTRNELIDLIRIFPLTKIGQMYGLSDNAIKRWKVKWGITKQIMEH